MLQWGKMSAFGTVEENGVGLQNVVFQQELSYSVDVSRKY